MDIEQCFDTMKDLQHKLLSFIEKSDNDEENYQNLITIFNDQKIKDDQCKFKSFLMLISHISQNHCRPNNFFSKIEKILLFFKDEMKKCFSNYEIFFIFKKSKRILLFLIKNNLLTIDQPIAHIMQKSKYVSAKYVQYFFPEIKKFLSEAKIEEISKEIPEDFEEKRSNAENDSEVCEIIRKDSVDEFVSFVEKTKLSLDSNVEESIFETNSFLLKGYQMPDEENSKSSDSSFNQFQFPQYYPVFGQPNNTLFSLLTPGLIQPSNPMLNQQMNPMLNQQMNPMLNQQMNPMLNQQMNPMLNQQANPMLNQQVNPMLNQQSNPMLNQQSNPILNQQSNPMLNQQSNQMLNQQENPASNTEKDSDQEAETSKFSNVMLIEYAAFFGSIKIIKHLIEKNARMSPSIWIYATHSNNIELMQLLDEKKIKPLNLQNCFEKSIKCYHNATTVYIQSNYLLYLTLIPKDIFKLSLKYHNYDYLRKDFINFSSVFNLCEYDHPDIFKILLDTKKIDINAKEIRNICFNSILFVNYVYVVY